MFLALHIFLRAASYNYSYQSSKTILQIFYYFLPQSRYIRSRYHVTPTNSCSLLVHYYRQSKELCVDFTIPTSLRPSTDVHNIPVSYSTLLCASAYGLAHIYVDVIQPEDSHMNHTILLRFSLCLLFLSCPCLCLPRIFTSSAFAFAASTSAFVFKEYEVPQLCDARRLAPIRCIAKTIAPSATTNDSSCCP